MPQDGQNIMCIFGSQSRYDAIRQFLALMIKFVAINKIFTGEIGPMWNWERKLPPIEEVQSQQNVDIFGTEIIRVGGNALHHLPMQGQHVGAECFWEFFLRRNFPFAPVVYDEYFTLSYVFAENAKEKRVDPYEWTWTIRYCADKRHALQQRQYARVNESEPADIRCGKVRMIRPPIQKSVSGATDGRLVTAQFIHHNVPLSWLA
jgi:hypothetical protein